MTNQEINAKPTRRQVKRRHRRLWISVSAALTLVLALGALTTGAFGLLPASGQAETSDYQVVNLTTGTLTKSVTGTGTISMNGALAVTVPAGLTVAKVDADAGDSVQAGDALVTLDVGSVQSKLDSLNAELATLNTELAALSGDTASSTVTATVKGRVKLIYGHAGDDVQTVMKNSGALMVLSVDGYMKVEVDVSDKSVSLNQSASVILPSGSVLTGSVSSISDDGIAKVLVSDATLAVGENVSVRDSDGNVLGSGVAQINNPLRVTGSAGTIKSVSYSINSSVSKGSTLFMLKNLPISSDYAIKLAEREACLDEIAAMQGYLENPVITSTASGIVKTIDLSAGQALEEDALISLTTRESITMSASVDELDILSVQPGMTAEVTLDAIPGETFMGTITRISAQGATTSNVTTYPVKIELEDDGRFLPGMSATASITVQRSENALLVPVAALNSARGETFVYVSSGLTTVSATSDPGIRTVITTGLSNDEYAEVLSGLSITDQVVVTKSAVTSSSSSSQQQGGIMGDSMMALSGSGGTPPSDMGGRPNG